MHAKDRITEQKIVCIVRGLPAGQLRDLAEALYRGGIRAMEITFDQRHPESWSETAAGIRMLSDAFSGRMLPGAGTVLTEQQLQMARDAGAQFIISPNTKPSLIARTRQLGLVSMPGAFTPTEIVEAWEAGADFVKVFPAGSLGPAYIRAVKAPLSHIPLMAVGGVSETNASDFLRAGAAGVGVGGNLVNKEWINAGEWEKITSLAAEYVKAVQSE